MAKTQLDHLKAHLRSGRSISALEALGLYGAFRLAARIKELRDRGWAIDTEMKEDPNGKPYASYKLSPKNDHGLPDFAQPDSHKKD